MNLFEVKYKRFLLDSEKYVYEIPETLGIDYIIVNKIDTADKISALDDNQLRLLTLNGYVYTKTKTFTDKDLEFKNTTLVILSDGKVAYDEPKYTVYDVVIDTTILFKKYTPMDDIYHLLKQEIRNLSINELI